MKLLPCLLVLLLPVGLFAQTNPPPQINLAGTFNDWSPSNSNYRLTRVNDQTYELTRFFRAGAYQFKFTFDSGWDKHLGEGPGGVLVQPGTEIPLKIAKHGEYRITLNLAEHRWKIQDAPVTVPHVVINIPGPVDLNLPITLDASESVAREGRQIRIFEFVQDSNDTVRAVMFNRQPTNSQAEVRLSKVGDYHFWVTVNDGVMSQPELVTLRPRMSYQVVGKWTGYDTTNRATFLIRTGPTTFERILKSTEPTDQRLSLISNHYDDILTNITVKVTQTNQRHEATVKQGVRHLAKQ